MHRLTLVLAVLLVACGGPVGPAAESPAPIAGKAALRDQATALAEQDWPWWRGAAGDGVARGAEPPLSWGAEENVRWTVAVGNGHASPVVVGGRVYVFQADVDAGAHALVCLDADTGKQAWRCEVARGTLTRVHPDNSHASGTPVCDGARCYVTFAIDGEVRLAAVSLDGALAWTRKVADYGLKHGPGTSPVLYRSSVIVATDARTGGAMVAFDRDTGEEVWRVARPGSDSYSVPAIGTLAGKTQLVIHAGNATRGYDPETGTETWRCDGPASTCANTPTLGADLVYTSGGYPEKKLLAIRGDGSGEVAWTDKRDVCYVTTMLLHEGRLYAVTDKGVATCYDAATGERRWREKLREKVSASPVVAGGRIYLAAESGKTFVLAPGDTYQLLGTSTLPGRQMATPTFVGKRVYLRTDTTLYCIEEQ